MAAKTATPALVVATRAAERRDGFVAAAHHSFVKVAAEAKYSGLRAQMTDRTEAANVVLRRQRPSAASGPELFQLYEEEPSNGRPAPLPELSGPQDRVRRCFVEQITESFVLVRVGGFARPNLTPAFEQTLMDDTEQVIEVPKISCPPRPPFRSALADSRVSVLFSSSFLPSRKLTFQFLALVVCWMVEVFMVLSQDRVQQRLLREVFMVLSQDTVQQCLFVKVPKALFPNRVLQHLVEQILVLFFKALSQDRVQSRRSSRFPVGTGFTIVWWSSS